MNLKNGRAVMWPTVLKEGLFLGDFPLLGLKEVGKGEKRRAGICTCVGFGQLHCRYRDKATREIFSGRDDSLKTLNIINELLICKSTFAHVVCIIN